VGDPEAARDATGPRGSARHRAFLDATLPHLDTVYRVARHAEHDPQLAEDLVQETYLRAYAAFDTHRGESTRSWLVAICLNLVRSDWRRRARRPREELTAGLGDEAARPRRRGDAAGGRLAAHGAAAPHGDDVFAAVQARMSRQTVTRALGRLSEEQRVAVVLMDLAGHTASEVAELLGCPRGTVLARAHRGRRRLAQLLVSEGADHDLF
jgi:RNA polymerase sigma-70 factor (ECF subfamily)